jgi:predicted P-loop ATPase
MGAGDGDIVARAAFALDPKAKRTPSGYECKCPCHDDRTASLSIGLGDNGSLVWHCHAGCSQEAVGAALKAAGGFPEREAPSSQRRQVATYDYVDESGELVFQVVRYQPKDFRQRRRPRDGDDATKIHHGWFWGMRGTRVVPYRLPEVLAAIAGKLPVAIVEGEKDADNLARLGIPATCNAMGASKSNEKCKWTAKHAAYLKGADVIILPDNDEPGRRHAAGVAASLAGIAKRIRVIELPGLPEKGDVSDWLADGGTSDALWEMAERTPVWRPGTSAIGAGEWQKQLLRTAKGEVKALLANATLALREAPEWAGVLAFNQLKLTIEIASPPPWAHRNGAWIQRAWSDNDDVRCAEWLQRAGIEVGHTIAHAALAEVAEGNAYHPVRKYLEGLAWDGIERIAAFAVEMLGADDTPFVRAVSSAMLIAAVARAVDPGCKADNIPVLEGPQGKFKSTAIETLFGREWFTDNLAEIGSKEASAQIGKCWCAEIADLASMRRADIETVKAFASRRVDIFRPPYGRAVIEVPRQAVMWGTTNQVEWIKDETGGRRFWPVECGAIDIAGIARARNQLWAEALFCWRQGEPWWLTDRATIELAREAQESRQLADAWDERIADYVRNKDDVSVGEVLQFGLVLEPGKWGHSEQIRVARYLRSKGWKRRRPGAAGQQKWRYFKPETEPKNQLDLGY